MKYILDTSAYVGFKKNRKELVETIVEAEQILFSTIVLGELMFGFRNGSRFRENMRDLDAFLACEGVELLTADRHFKKIDGLVFSLFG